MKKIFALLITIALVVFAFASVSAATPALSIKPSATAVNSTESIYVSVKLDQSAEIKSLGLTVDCDSEVFTIISGKWLVENMVMSDAFGSHITKNAVMLLKKDTDLSGDIFEFTLRVNDSAPKGTYSIKVTPVAKNSGGDVTLSAASVDIRINPDLGPNMSSSNNSLTTGSVSSDNSSNNDITNSASGSQNAQSSGTVTDVSNVSPSDTASGTSSSAIQSSDNDNNVNQSGENNDNNEGNNVWMIVFIVSCAVIVVAVAFLIIYFVKKH